MNKHFCINCGTSFEAENNMVRYCPACSALKKEEQKQKQKQYAKARMARLDLVNITVYKSDKDKLKEQAEAKGITVAEFIKTLVSYTEPKQTTTKAAKATTTKKKA